MRNEQFTPKTKVVARDDEIVREATGKRVLHIGLGGLVDDAELSASIRSNLEYTLHYKLSKVSEELTGIDIIQENIDFFEERVPGEYFFCDVGDEAEVAKMGRTFDLVIFSDVIEHLDNVRSALSGLKRVLNPGGHILLTTVNAFCFETIAKLLARYESVHPEHTAYFSYSTMKRLLHMNGLVIEKFKYYRQIPRSYTSLSHRVFYSFGRVVEFLFPQYAEGLFFIVRTQEECSAQ